MVSFKDKAIADMVEEEIQHTNKETEEQAETEVTHQKIFHKCQFCGKEKPCGTITDRETLQEIFVCRKCFNNL